MPVTAGRALALATVPTMMFCLSPLNRALADDYFDPAALEFADPQQQTSDLHYFAKPGGQQPGTYSVTVVVNDQELGQADITFVDDGGKLQPVLTPGQLADYGVNVSAFPAFQTLHEGETFTRIEKFIPDASSRFTFANQRLTLSIPQAAMNVQSRGYVDPSRWDDGVPAAFVDYYFSGAQIKNADDGESSRSNYLNLRSGVNLGAWRLRNVSSMQYDQQRRHWDTQSTWLQRDVRSLKSLLRIGDTYTTGDVFDSIPFRGVQLMSDDEMLPDSQRGFAPHHPRRGAQQCQSDRLSARVCDLRNLRVAGGICHQRSLPHLAERRSGGEGDREQWFGAHLYSALFRSSFYAARRARQIQP